MQLYSSLFAELASIQRALVDATTLILFISLPLWFFVFSPAYRQKIKDDANHLRVALVLFVEVLTGLYIIQLLIMLVLPDLMAGFPPQTESLIDAGLTVLFSAPLFMWLFYRLELHSRTEPLADFLNAPITLYILLLFMIFLADMLQEIIFHQFDMHLTAIHFQLFDALVSILLIAPLLLFLVVRPLRRMARSEKARSSIIYDQVVDAIIKIDREGVIESFNLAAENVFGLRADFMIGKPAGLLIDRGQIDLVAVLQELVSDSEVKPLRFNELSAQHSDGSGLVLNVSISKIKLDGPDEFLLLLRDISERKAAEDALLATDAIFREIFNQTEDAIIFLEPGSGEILDVNTKAESLYGYSKRELQEEGIHAFCDDDVFVLIKGMISKIDEFGNAQIDHLVNHRKDGEQIVVSVRGKMMTLQGAQVIYCTVRDISERIGIEKESREIQAKLIHANKMTSLGLLVSGVAHEINNPNNLVLSNAQLLSKIWKDAQVVLNQYYQEHGEFMIGGMNFSDLENHAPDMFYGITDGSRRINAIVNDLKRFVRQDVDLFATDVDINKVASAAVSMLHYEIIRYTDNFQIDLAEDLPLVKGSSQQLGQVVINLLMNACQALPDKSCAVWLETNYDQEHNQVMLSVRDQGCGLPEEAKEKILEPFFTTKLDAGGTGLGLSISQTILKDHGGKIEFSSQTETGTTFTVTLPGTRSDESEPFAKG